MEETAERQRFLQRPRAPKYVSQTGFFPACRGAEAVRISGTVGRGTATTFVLKKQWCLGTTPLMSFTAAEG